MATPSCVTIMADISSWDRPRSNPQLFRENWRLPVHAANGIGNRMKFRSFIQPYGESGTPTHILWPHFGSIAGRGRTLFHSTLAESDLSYGADTSLEGLRQSAHSMIHGRIETTPNEQLLELRRARDRYAALAEQTSEQASETSEEDLERQQDARRILLAYEKSIANMTASMDRMHQAELLAPVKFERPFKLAAVLVSIAVFAGAAYYLLAGPGAHWLRFSSLQASQTAKPASSAVPAAGPHSMLPQETALTGNASVWSPDHVISPVPIPIARPDIQEATPKPAALQRPVEQIQPSQNPVRARPIAAAQTNTPDQPRNGFMAKVIQPDGSFKEEFFSSAPSR